VTGVPDLDDVAGEWMEASELAHLPSLRNQWGQGHVNHDLSSMSWLAAPPYTFGYHTGTLQIDGETLPAQRYRWKPWGVQREHVNATLHVRTDTRMGLAQDILLWQIAVTNPTDRPVQTTVSQDLFAMVAHTEIGWGWLYDVPWTADNHHDFMTLERIRAATRGDAPYLLGSGARRLRLGKPRLPGIQRDGGSEAMSLSTELPRHVSPDTVYPYDSGAHATVRNIKINTTILYEADLTVAPTSDIALDPVELHSGDVFAFELRLDVPDQTGVVLTHGNHPDSLQVGVDAGRLWFGIAGEKEYVADVVAAGGWHAVTVELDDARVALFLDGTQVAATGHWSTSSRWKSLTDGDSVSIADSLSSARAGYAFDTCPDAIDELGAGARATWSLHLDPGETRTIGLVCAYGDDASDVAAAACAAAGNFDGALASVEDGYRDLWRSAFTPGNPHFSGHLPVLDALDAGLAKSYYMGALLAIYMRNTRVSETEPIFLTGGPRLGPTTTYFWDHTEWSRLYALLEPAGLRSWLLRALGSPYDECFGFDTRGGGPLGNDYVSNDYSLFRLIEHYVCVTGDRAFLDEVAGERTVFEHLDRLAHAWRDKRTAATGGVLADFGPDPWQLLECVPNYVNVVASFNAAYVGMMRSFAGLLRVVGRADDAVIADAEADTLAAAVIGMALPDGRWRIGHPDRADSIGHCLDFGLVAAHLHGDLDDGQRASMVDFVSTKLLAATWMRALALDDPAAPLANRPDHGAAGAFGAWPGVTAYGFAKLGRPDLAHGLLSVVHASGSGGLWGQAMEIVDDDQVRVAEDGVSNRDSVAGVATAEAVLSGLFGFEPTFPAMASGAFLPETIHVPDIGTLSYINVGGF
jgi:hypothetical protein